MQHDHNVEFPQLERIKRHVRKHKQEYIAGISGAALATITCAIMKGRNAGVLRVPDGSDRITIRPFTFFSPRTNIVTLIDRGTSGPPSWVVRCKETGEVFVSQLQAAKAMDISPSNLSSHLNGKYDEVAGYTFERLCLAG